MLGRMHTFLGSCWSLVRFPTLVWLRVSIRVLWLVLVHFWDAQIDCGRPPKSHDRATLTLRFCFKPLPRGDNIYGWSGVQTSDTIANSRLGPTIALVHLRLSIANTQAAAASWDLGHTTGIIWGLPNHASICDCGDTHVVLGEKHVIALSLSRFQLRAIEFSTLSSCGHGPSAHTCVRLSYHSIVLSQFTLQTSIWFAFLKIVYVDTCCCYIHQFFLSSKFKFLLI